MPLIKDCEIVEDSWTSIEDDADLPADGDIIISLERLTEQGSAIKDRKGRTGLRLPNTAEVSDLKDLLQHLSLVALEFPAFTDGRAYSQAWHLRHEQSFVGEIRATGNVLADQAAYMLRSGFDSFEIPEGKNIETIRQSLAAMTHAYQRGYGETTNAFRRQFSLR